MAIRDVKLVQTIFAEMNKVQRNLAETLAKRDLNDIFCDIQHPSGFGSVMIGRKGFDALTELTRSAVKSAGLSGWISEHTARRHLGPILLQRFDIDREPIELRTVQKAFGEAIAKMRRVLKSRAHLVPCHLMDTDDPDELKLGPVRFINRTLIRRMLLSGIPLKNDGDWKDIDRELLAQAIRHYRGYRWVAVGQINDCDPELATDYAVNAATLAISCLQLLFGARGTQHMAVSGPQQGWSREAAIRLTADAQLDFTISRHFKGGASFEAGWSKELEHPGIQIALRLCGLALESALPGQDRPLSDRALGAIQWFGEAVREEAPATRLIKFMTAIEHIVLTGERGRITDAMGDRVAALAYDLGSAPSREETKKEFLRLYDLRSKLVHGRISPWNPAVRSELGAAADLAERVLNGALNAWREPGLMSQRARPKLMKRWFEEAVWMMARETEPVAHVDAWRVAKALPTD